MLSNRPKTPVLLKSDCINELDHLLCLSECTELILVALLPKIVDEHISTTQVLDTISQIDDLLMEWMPLSHVADCIYSKAPLFCMVLSQRIYISLNI